MAKTNLTESFVKGIPATDQRQTFRDKQVGFGLRVEPKAVGGRKSYFYNAKVGGRVLYKSIGVVEHYSVKQAREEAASLAVKAKEWVKAGCPDVLADNPFAKQAQAAPEAKNAAPTFETLVERYIKDLHNPNRKKGKRKKIHNPIEAEKSLRYALKKYFQSWLPRPVDSFTPKDVATLRDSALPHEHMGNRLVQWSKAIFNFCANDGDGNVNVWPMPVNPAVGIAQFDEPERERWLTESELVLLEKALDAKETPQDVRDFVRLSLDTSARKENILAAKWSEFDMDSKQWRIPKSKGGAYTVDLLPRAVKIIERRKSERKSTSEYVFANTNAPRGYLRIDKEFQELRKRLSQTEEGKTFVDVRIHDLRRTSATYQARAGMPLQKISGNLGHSERNLESVAIYAKLAQVDLREVRQAGADKMAELMAAARKRMAAQKRVPVVGGAR